MREVYPQIVGSDVVGYEANDSSSFQQLWTGIIEDSALESTDAVTNMRVYAVLGNLLEREWFLGIQYLAKWCHPGSVFGTRSYGNTSGVFDKIPWNRLQRSGTGCICIPGRIGTTYDKNREKREVY